MSCDCTCAICNNCTTKQKNVTKEWHDHYDPPRRPHLVEDFLPLSEKLGPSFDINALINPNKPETSTTQWDKQVAKIVVANMGDRRCDHLMVFPTLDHLFGCRDCHMCLVESVGQAHCEKPIVKACPQHLDHNFKRAVKLYNGTIRTDPTPFCILCLTASKKYFFAKSEAIYNLTDQGIITGDDFSTPCSGANCTLLLPPGLTYCSTTCLDSNINSK
jgi:hypothetical protein